MPNDPIYLIELRSLTAKADLVCSISTNSCEEREPLSMKIGRIRSPLYMSFATFSYVLESNEDGKAPVELGNI